MKVLHLATSLTNGAGKAARRINESINEVDVESKVITAGRAQGPLKLNEIRLTPSTTRKLFSKSLTLLQKSIVENGDFPCTPISLESLDLGKVVSSHYDILNIHASYNLLSINSIKYLLSFGKPIVFTLHDERFYTGGCHNTLGCTNFQQSCEKCPIATNLGKLVVKKAFSRELSVLKNKSRFLSIVAPSNWIMNQAESSLKLQGIRIVQIPNPIPGTIYFHQDNSSNRHSSLNKVTIGFIAANLENPFKGLKNLIEAIKLMDSKERENYRIFLVGEASHIDFKLPIETLCFTLSKDLDVAKILGAIDILVVPSIGDNSPSVISESQMTGTKVIGSNRGGIPEMLAYDTKLLFNPESPHSILEKIRINSGVYERRIIANSAASKYSYQTVGLKYKEHYKNCLNDS